MRKLPDESHALVLSGQQLSERVQFDTHCKA
jgi:hypothetical protein